MDRWTIAQSAEIRWWKRYLGSKPVEDYLRWKRDYWRNLMQPLAEDLKLEQHQHILDAGCGPAGTFLVLENHTVTAIDPLLDKYEEQLSHFNPASSPWTSFRRQRIEDLEEEKVYDGICCLNAINHVADIELACDRLISSLKPGGWIVLGIDSHNHQSLKQLFRMVPGDILHPHQFDREEYRQMLESRKVLIRYDELIKHEFIFDYRVMAGRLDQSSSQVMS